MKFAMARRMENLKASEVRELLKITELPDVISFAGGLPAPETFPAHEMAEIAGELLEKEGRKALQYSTTEGDKKLRALLAERMTSKRGIEATADDILIVSGSQQALDLTGKVFLDEGDIVLCESPTYLAAINAFKTFQPRFVQVPTDEDGMLLPELERLLAEHERSKFIYVIPDFQNPSGRTWSLERRLGLLELAARFGIPVIEDSPYGELCFEGEPQPPLKSLDRHNLVVYMSTFSKILSPGVRIGWVVAEKSLLNKYVMVKQSADLHTSTIGQLLVRGYLERFDLDSDIAKIRELYRCRRDIMLRTMDEELPAGVSYTRPKGGLFLWVELPEGVDGRKVLEKCLERKVAIVPGGAFFPEGGHENTFRLNFSNMKEDLIVEGIRRMAAVLKELISASRGLAAEGAA
jgi:2-aminoadipate transaminase